MVKVLMRPIAILFFFYTFIASECRAQIPAPSPVPGDPHELVTGTDKAVAKQMDRTEALKLLNKAKRPMRLHAPVTPPHLLTVTFTATGDPANSGTGKLTELWLGQQNWRWTARLGSFEMTRVGTLTGTFDEKPVPLVPMRIHMMRNTLFWAAQGLTANSQFRSAAVEWNGRPATCLLVSDQLETSELTRSRRWDEEEYCIDDQTGLLQVFSVAPGNYVVYSYSGGLSFHGQPIPDGIKTFVAGAVAIDASVRIEDPGVSDTIPSPSAEMMAASTPVGLEEPLHTRIDITSSSISGATSVMVNAQIGPAGKVVTLELCAASDPSLARQALARVKEMSFGRSAVQRQAYVEVQFVANIAARPARLEALPSVPRVTTEPYYLERMVSVPGYRFGDAKEILARRSDGATLRMSMVGPSALGRYVRDLKFPDGTSVAVYDSVTAKVTWPAMSDLEKSIFRSNDFAPSDCHAGSGGGTLLRYDQIEGQDVAVIQSAAGSYRTTIWAAPKLACEHLLVKAETMQSNGTFLPSAETKTVKLVVGEPDARLFNIPPDLAEMKPSEARRRLWDSLDLGLSAEEKAGVLRGLERQDVEADKRYQGNRP